MHMEEGVVEVVAKVVTEASEEIVLTDHGQDRYKIRRVPFKILFNGSALLVLYLS